MKLPAYITAMLLAAAALWLAPAATAETHYKPRISIGARAGASMGRMSFAPSVSQTWTTGSTGAITFRYTEEKLFGLIAELGWVQRGWKEDFEEAPLNYNRTLTYLQLPILTHIYFGSRRFKAFINLGPQICYMIHDNIEADFDYHHPETVEGFPLRNRSTEQMYTEVKNKFDYGICASVGGEFFVQPRHSILLEARYYFGLGNIFPSSKADTFSASRVMSLEFSIGYFFRLK